MNTKFYREAGRNGFIYVLSIIVFLPAGCSLIKMDGDNSEMSSFHAFYVLCYKAELGVWPMNFYDMAVFEPETEHCRDLKRLSILNGESFWARYPTTEFKIREDSGSTYINAKVAEELTGNILVPIEPHPFEFRLTISKEHH